MRPTKETSYSELLVLRCQRGDRTAQEELIRTWEKRLFYYLRRLYDLLDKICEGWGTARDLALLEELAPMVQETSLCGLGMTAPNPLLSTLRYFRDEYLALLKQEEPAAPTPAASAQ